MNRFHSAAALVVCLLLCAGGADGEETGAAILAKAGVTGGLVVHLGCADGRLTASLWQGESYCVHGLDADPANVRSARKRIESLGLYGKVSVDGFDGARLPYVDNMVNLIVADGRVTVPKDEIMRVLVPGGVAVIGGRKSVKPRPGNIDEWTHYLHGPDNNAVADDTVAGPPRHFQWQGGPKWSRHHDRMSSVSALVSSGGRLFYIFDEGSTASIMLPSRWALVARDAFNGKVLWRKKIGTWYTRFKGLKDGPADAPRRLVASGGRVYATLDLHGPLTSIDAVTGKTVHDYEGTKGAEEVILSEGVLFVLVGPGSIGNGGRMARPVEKRTIVALDADSGRKLWQASDVVAAATMAADGARVYYFNFREKQAVALDRGTGRRLWSSEALPSPAKQTSFFASRLVVRDGVVLFAGGEHSGMTKSGGGETRADTLTALSAETGKTLWKGKHPPSGYSSPENLFVIDDVVWCDTSSNGKLDGTLVGMDLKTGAVKHRFPADEKNYWFHHRCYAGRATTNYVMTSRTGIEFIDFRRKHWDINHWVRGACLYGIMPSNGLIYTPPNPCICYAETMLHGFNALAPASKGRIPEPVGRADRLERGPAYGRPAEGKASPGDWPTYRCDNSRRGSTDSTVRAKLATAWGTDLGGRPSGLIVADGKVFVAAVDRHTVHAIDARSGRKLWQFTAGGRVDSPPTYFRGSVLFGSADGRVYRLRASDGELIWRFLAAPVDRRMMAHEQIESLWPVHGSILVRDGIAHFVAGRSIFVDGGMRLYRLDAGTGKVISETVLDERNPKTGKNVQELVKWLNMPVGLPDVLSCDGKRIYMRSQAFDLEGKRLAMGPKVHGAQEGKAQGGEGTHLFCPTGFLDDTWFHRTYWMYGRTWGSGWCGYYVAGKHAPAGRIMCVGDDLVYVFGRQPRYYRWTVPMEYRLFAARKEWKGAARKPQPDRKGRKRRARGGPGPIDNKANYAWSTGVPILVRAMALAAQTLFIAGPRDLVDENGVQKRISQSRKLLLRQEAALAGGKDSVLWAVSAKDGRKLAEYELGSPPVFDGMAVGDGRLYLTTVGGKVLCFAAR